MKNIKFKLLPLALIIGIASLILVFSVLGLNTQQNEPQLNIVATNLSFNDSIYIKYAVSFDEVDADNDVKLLIWRNPDADYLMGTEEIALSSVGTLKISDRECLIFNYTDLAAKEVTDVVYARAVYQKDGQTYYSDVKKYSVLTYVYNKLGYTGTATQNEDLASLLKGLLQYGASAQTYFNYKTDTLATDKHVKVSLVNGHFDDGCATALVVPGSKLTITAPLESEHGRFAYWENEDGEIISSSQSYEITAGEVNSSFSAIYASYEGGVVEGAGSSISDDSFALTPHPVNIDSVMDLTASELEAQIREGLEANAVYRVSDGNTVTITDGFDGNGAAIIVPAGITFDSMDNTTVSNVIMLSSVSISNSSQVTFSEVDIQSESNAISVAENCADITLDNCRIIAAKTAFETLSDQTVIKNSYIKGSNGVVLNASENTVYNSHIISDDDAIYSCGSDNALNNNTILTSTNGEGIVIASESLNSLLSYNVVSGTEVSLNIQDATNTVVLFNSFYTAIAENNVNLYIVKNSIGGALELSYNNYLLCDANAYADNESDHTLVSLGNENTNGDTLMDVTARNQVGAKEELLPHTNKDLFLEMERKDIVKDVAGTSLDLHTYIEENAKSNGIVIIPPGAYRTAQADTLILGEAMSNTDIYAFGVYNEHGFITNEEYLTNPNRNNYLISISGAENISIHGMTLAYNYQSLGQAHILQKMDNNQILIVPAAGFDLEAGWGLSNSGIFRGSFYACHKGDSTPWFETETSYTYVQTNADKTIVIEVTEDVYNKLGVGDILCCRMAGDNQRTIEIKNAEKILFKDCVIHGYSAAIACIVSGRSYEVKYERVHNCPKSPAIIDEETYDLYKSFEANYPGVDFEMYKDEEDRYRGTQPRFCSVDATHITSGQGLDIESCLFEQMCDDGSNQHGTSSRLYGIKDNGDGKTATVYIKGNVTQIYHNLYASGTNHVMNMTPGTYLEGDNIFIYTPGGEIVCDATCLTNSKSESHLSEIYNLGKMTYYIHVVSVTVPIESVNFAALEGFDLKDNHFRIDNKIIVDNISYVSGNFTVDNYMIRNSWSRGVLTKTVGATVKYSTFRHIKSAGILAHCEPEWGESTIPRNITVEYCLFDETGHVGESWDDPKNAPFYISGLSTYGEANIDRIVANNIKINGCHFLNYGHQYGICIDGAHSITITNNIFDPLTTSDPGHFVNIKTAVNVELSGNQYRNESDELSTIRGIEADDYVYIHGSDVGDEFKEACDVYIAGTHLSCFKIVPADKENIVVGDILSKKLKAICGYTVASTVMPYTNEVKLVVKDSTSTAIKSHAYTVECIDGQLIITAETNAALIYAVEDFASWIANQNQTQQSIYFAEGYSEEFEFSINELVVTNENIFKYRGVWEANGSAMKSGADADYVEFKFTGHSFTLRFNGETTFDISIDGANAVEYTVTGEKTFTLNDGEHTVRVLTTDHTKSISFRSVMTYSSLLTKTDDKTYVQFIGDSMVDYDTSFAHRVGDVLGWDYSVVVGDTIPTTPPTTSVTRAPDVFVLFFGTDDIVSTNADTTEFVTAYTTLISNITSNYKSAKVYVLLPFSTSDLDSTRQTAINKAVSEWKNLSWSNLFSSKVKTVSCTDWGIELDTTASTTHPTLDGDYTVTVKLAKYLLQNAGNSNYINATFSLDKMSYHNNDSNTTFTKNNTDEGGFVYNRYCFGIYSHAYITPNTNYATSITNSGRYLIIKYRASGEADLILEVRTNIDQDGSDGTTTLSSATKRENNVPEDWEVAIIDLAQFEKYKTNVDNTQVQVRISTESNIFDIAYAAIVDDLTEAEMAAMLELGATQYRLYEDWSKVGTDVSLNGQEPEVPIDLSFVNQEFGILGMGVYNGTKSSLPITEEGVDFMRFNFTETGHVLFYGNNKLAAGNNFIDITGDTGRYFIVKYRSTNNANIILEALTSDYEYDDAGSNLAMKTKTAGKIQSGVWETAVIDLSVFTNSSKGTQYTTDADLNVWIRFTTGASEIDISYIAIVDDLDEANTFIKYKGDTSFVHYIDWSKTGTTVAVQ